MKRLLWLVGVAVLISLPASCSTVDFDDLPLPGYFSFDPIPNGYGGLDWNNMYTITYGQAAEVYPNSGYVNGTISPLEVAYNGYGNPASITSDMPFTFNSGYFTGALEDGLQLKLVGKYQSNQLFTTTITLNTEMPVLVVENWSGLDELDLSTTCTTQCYVNSNQFALDNLTVNATPEPSYVALVGVGLLAFYFRRRQRG